MSIYVHAGIFGGGGAGTAAYHVVRRHVSLVLYALQQERNARPTDVLCGNDAPMIDRQIRLLVNQS